MKGLVVLVTGGANGLGLCLTRRLRDEGAKVIVWDVDKDALAEIKHEVEDAMYVDVSDEACVAENAKKVLERYEKVDILINNAGIVSGREILQLDAKTLTRTFSVNVFASFWTVKAFLQRMMDYHKGHIVTVCSVAGLEGAPKLAEYSASKFAAFGFNECLRREIQQAGYSGIKTTIVCPYFFIGQDVSLQRFARWPLSWLVPVLRTDYVARKIVDAIRWEKAIVVMPRFLAYAKYIRGLLPIWLTDRLSATLTDMSSHVELHGHKIGEGDNIGSRHKREEGKGLSKGLRALAGVYSSPRIGPASAVGGIGGITRQPSLPVRTSRTRRQFSKLHAMRHEKSSAGKKPSDPTASVD